MGLGSRWERLVAGSVWVPGTNTGDSKTRHTAGDLSRENPGGARENLGMEVVVPSGALQGKKSGVPVGSGSGFGCGFEGSASGGERFGWLKGGGGRTGDGEGK